jgi:hypothetical protein
MKFNAMKFFGAALLALALVLVPALVDPQHMVWALTAASMLGLAGAVTVTYKFPVSGTTPPTAIQSSRIPTVTGLINWLESDTTGLFTHNFGISTGLGFAGLQPSLLSFFPEVIITPVLNSGTVYPNIQIDYTTSDGNQLVFFKGSIAGTGGTVLLTVRKPHSIGM